MQSEDTTATPKDTPTTTKPATPADTATVDTIGTITAPDAASANATPDADSAGNTADAQPAASGAQAGAATDAPTVTGDSVMDEYVNINLDNTDADNIVPPELPRYVEVKYLVTMLYPAGNPVGQAVGAMLDRGFALPVTSTATAADVCGVLEGPSPLLLLFDVEASADSVETYKKYGFERIKLFQPVNGRAEAELPQEPCEAFGLSMIYEHIPMIPGILPRHITENLLAAHYKPSGADPSKVTDGDYLLRGIEASGLSLSRAVDQMVAGYRGFDKFDEYVTAGKLQKEFARRAAVAHFRDNKICYKQATGIPALDKDICAVPASPYHDEIVELARGTCEILVEYKYMSVMLDNSCSTGYGVWITTFGTPQEDVSEALIGKRVGDKCKLFLSPKQAELLFSFIVLPSKFASEEIGSQHQKVASE